MPDDNWVKLSRSIDRLGWRRHPNTVSVWCWILTHVNSYDTSYYSGDIELRKGQAAATIGAIATACGMTYKAVRYALRMLSDAGDIEVEHVKKCIRISLRSENTGARSGARSGAWFGARSEQSEKPTASTPPEVPEYPAGARSGARSGAQSGANPFSLYSRDNQDIRQDYASTPPISPSFEEVRDYFRDHDYKRDPQRFYSYNQARGWTVKDWRAAADLWESYTDRQDRRDPKPTQKDQEESSSIDWDSVHQMVLEVPTFRKGEPK